MSPAFRDAVLASGLRDTQLNDWEARKLRSLSALTRMSRRGKLLGREIFLCEIAAGRGELAQLKKAREKQIKWNKRTCEAAARYGHLEVLK